MTPAIAAVKKRRINFRIQQYKHDSQSQSYGLEAADDLGVDEELVFKTLL